MLYAYDKDNLLVRKTINQDIENVAKQARKSDIDEVMASHGFTIFNALERSVFYSKFAYTLIANESEYLAIFGLSETIDKQIGGVWLLGTDNIKKHSGSFYKASEYFIDLFLHEKSILYNYVDARNKTSIRWLKALGAMFEDAKPRGPQNAMFRKFIINRELFETRRL